MNIIIYFYFSFLILSGLGSNLIQSTHKFIKFLKQVLMQEYQGGNSEAEVNYDQTQPQSDLDQFIQVLGKPAQLRSPKQISILIQYAAQNKGLSEMMNKFSQKFIKTILMKHANAVCAGKNTLITKEGCKANNVYVILYGKMLLNTKSKQSIDDPTIYEKLGKAACDQVRQNNKLKRKKIARRLSIDFGIQQGNFSKATEIYPRQDLHQIYIAGVRDRSEGNKYLYDVITQTPCLFLQIPMPGFLHSLFVFYDQKVNSFYEKIHRIPCFEKIDKDKMQHFIMCLSQKKQKKGSYIYKQNDLSKSLYILVNGEIKLTKQSNLFVQNPNQLYANRVELMVQRQAQFKNRARYQAKLQQMKKTQAILPYADLSLMYNFQPKKKVIQICQISSFGLFGTEQFIENKTRETNAVCNSLQVVYYEISIDKIQQIIGSKNMPDFMKGLKQEVKQKVLHRQCNYANTINLENSTNLNYFYYDGDKEKQCTKKFRISKFNSKFIDSSPLPEKYKSADHKNAITPQYTAFNFNKLKSSSLFSPMAQVQTPQKTQKNKQKIENPQLKKSKQSNHDSDEQGSPLKANKQQIKIMNITHTWKLIKSKVDASIVKSQKISPIRYVIDVNDPLIDNNFLTNLDKQKRRVQRKIRKQRITLGQSRALSTTSKNISTF